MKKTTRKLVIIIIIVLMAIMSVLPFAATLFNRFKSLGYTKEDETKIKALSKETQEMFLQGYNDVLLKIIDTDGFDESKIKEYYYYYGVIDDNEKLMDFVNKGIINKENYAKIQEIYDSEYFINSKEDLYLKYLDNYNTGRDVLRVVNTNRYRVLYDDIQDTDLSKNYLMLINKYNKLPEDYEPEDLVDIESNYGIGQTRSEVYEQYKKLQDDGNELGYSFTICSAYRSYDYQNSLYNMYLDSEGSKEIVDKHSARPGHSEHQSGLCLDLTTPEYGMDDFGLSDAGKWVNDNCYKYGFIIRYPENSEDITGYQSEPWQIRYVGSAEIAEDIFNRDITFDEYYACFVE